RIAQGLSLSPIEVCRNAAQYEGLSRKEKALRAAANLFDELEELSDTLDLAELIDAVAEKSGYMQAMRALGDEGAARIDNINELKSNALAAIEEDENITLPDFLEQVALVSDLDSYDSDADRVSLMTMHSAKGLEFDTVFLVGAEDNIFPSYRSLGDNSEMEEERRLAYVAITRAKRSLYVTHTQYRMLYGQTMRNKLSTFIREIPEELIVMKGGRPVSENAAASIWTKPQKPDYLAKEAAKKPVIPQPVASGEVFAEGDRVRHNVFGEGTVTQATRMGNDTMLSINFDKAGIKKLMANYARIKKV
ncbi:MAG: ATP-binding domain-containing protein, partial [Oscillospiraceae bacterium]|nr:ATP-binding domain-containing protein [Oscillospiraceae bacterium]